MEEGVDGALAYKYSPASARPRIFDGAAEAKLIALACGEPPKGRSRWTLQLLEEPVVELKIVERASDNTIGRTLKKRSQAASAKFSNRTLTGRRALMQAEGSRASVSRILAKTLAFAQLSGDQRNLAEPQAL